MRVAVVADGSMMVGRKCRHCPRVVLAGQTVVWQKLPQVRIGDDLFIVHATCLERLAEAAADAATRTPGEERASRRRLHATARRRAVASLCVDHEDELAARAEAELVVAALGG